jgi:hypothetical protein
MRYKFQDARSSAVRTPGIRRRWRAIGDVIEASVTGIGTRRDAVAGPAAAL